MAKEFKEEVIVVLEEGEKMVLRVVKWGNGRPLLVKQQKFETKDGETRFGKVKGLNLDDFELVCEKYDDIVGMLDG